MKKSFAMLLCLTLLALCACVAGSTEPLVIFERDLLLDKSNAEKAAAAFASVGVDVIAKAKRTKSAFSFYAAEIEDANGNKYSSRISENGTLVFIRTEKVEYIYMDEIMRKNQAIFVENLPIDDFAATLIAALLSCVEIGELSKIECDERFRHHVVTLINDCGEQYTLSLDFEGSVGYLLDEEGNYLYHAG